MTIGDDSIELTADADCQVCSEAQCKAALEGVFIMDRLFRDVPRDFSSCQEAPGFAGLCAYLFGRCDDNIDNSSSACSGVPATPVIDICTDRWAYMYLNIYTADADTWTAVLDIESQGTCNPPCCISTICTKGQLQVLGNVDAAGPAPFDCMATNTVVLDTVNITPTDGYPCVFSGAPDVSFEWGN
jgi:hypothetical protein